MERPISEIKSDLCFYTSYFKTIRYMNYKKNISMIRFNCSILLLHYCYTKRKAQHCVKSCIFEVILSAFSRIRNANAGKCGPELLRIRTLFTQCNAFICFGGAQQPHIKKFYNLGSWHGHLLLFRTKRFFLQWTQ